MLCAPCCSKIGLVLNVLGTNKWRFLGLEDIQGLPPAAEVNNFLYKGDGDPRTQDVWGDPDNGYIPVGDDDDLIGAVEEFLRRQPQ